MSSNSVCPTFRKVLVAFAFGACVFMIPNGVHAATSNSATLQWAANQETDLAGYQVYHGTTTGNYGSPQSAGKTTSYQYTNLEPNKTHYFSVTAFDHSGNESDPSPEVNTFIQAAVPPTLTSPKPNTTLEGANATFAWTPNETPVIDWAFYWGSVGENDIYKSGNLGSGTTNATITELPTDGRQLWVQLWYKLADGWKSLDYQFTAAAPISSSFPLTITKSGSGSGTITSNPVALDCGNICTASFSTESPITLSANAAPGSIFAGWGGACTGIGSCVVALSTSSASVSATFASSPPPPSALDVTVTGDGKGSVTGGVSCSSGTCSGMFSQGSSVTLTAAPSSGSTFAGWGGACTGTGSCVVALSTSSTSVSATFASSPTVSRSLSVSLTGDGNGSVTSSPSGLTCSGGTCNASFPQGTTVTLTPTTPSGNVFKGWNGVCSGTSNCAVTLSSSQVVSATFALENSEPSLPKPNLPILVNFQPTASQVPTNFKKDDGSVFTSTRGYGWNKLLNGTEQNSTADQTLDTFVGASNQSPGTWNLTIPNGIYYVTMVLGDPKDAQGPHWVSVEGFQLAKQVNTAGGEYLAIVDYSVEVKDSTLSLTLGNSGQGQTTLNYLAINEKPNLSNTSQTLAQSFGTTLVTSVLNSGEATKINPVVLVQKDQEEKDLQEKAIAQKIKEEEAAALAQVQVNEQKDEEVAKLNQIIKEQKAAARAQDRMEKDKEQEMAKLNEIKEKMSSIRESGGTVTLRNLLGGS